MMNLIRPFIKNTKLINNLNNFSNNQSLVRHFTTTTTTSDNNNKSILRDKFNRNHTYLRISLTEKCNLRCKYCMPEEGVMLQQADKILSTEEIIRLSKLFVGAGITKIRFTGGEPLVRKDVDSLIEKVGKIQGLKNIGITTNGILLSKKLKSLSDSGVNLFNISLDTLDPDKFTTITRRLGWDRVKQSIDNALELKNTKVKINCVVMKDLNDMEIVDFVEMTRHKNVETRFIEYMPFDGNLWKEKNMVTYSEMIKIIREKYPTFQKYTLEDEEPNNTSKTYHVPGFKGKVGFITSMSEHFCSSCNRLRITADGNLKVCLFGNTEVNLRDKIRQGATDQQLLEIINAAVLKKKASHAEKQQKQQFIQMRMYSSTSNNNSNGTFTHLTSDNKFPTMVDVSDKLITKRTAHARSLIEFPEFVLKQLVNVENGDSKKEINSKKGPVFSTSIVAGTMAVKNTWNLIPFCHPIAIESCKINIKIISSTTIQVDCIVSLSSKTGVEMEALTGASITSLCIYDMCKALSKEIIIKETKLISKTGGKSDF